MFDSYFVETGEPLKNKLNITDPKELTDVEYRLTAEKTSQILLDPIPDQLDFSYLLHLHAVLFGDLYDFAGQIRTVNIAKPDSPAPFCYADFIMDEADKLFTELAAKNYLANLEKTEFAEELAELSASLNSLHPFREGNGRTLRLYLDRLSARAGFLLDFSLATREEILSADQHAFAGDLTPIKSLYSKIITKL